MGQRNTMLRSMHDAGLAAWFGGSLMGAVGLNGAASGVGRRDERLRLSAAGWRRWAPVNLAAIGTHLLGASALLATERHRVAAQRGVAGMSAAKTGLTLAALGATAYAGVLGARLGKAGRVPVDGPTRAAEDTPDEVRAVQRQQRVMQWGVPALTGALIAISALAGEQQKPAPVMRGLVGRMGQLGNVGKLASLTKPAVATTVGRMLAK
ncbi:hypothetical protein GCM10023322_75080 [Rugosimonospora acidiphila]|uniref:DUF4235 domain-containing protein n=1 Tax=Rugosimonospora acidiphila TaxID=556531 RepID=A0ABP9SNX3_9ACTN